MQMSADFDKSGGGGWSGPDRWQVFLAAASLLVAIIALVR